MIDSGLITKADCDAIVAMVGDHGRLAGFPVQRFFEKLLANRVWLPRSNMTTIQATSLYNLYTKIGAFKVDNPSWVLVGKITEHQDRGEPIFTQTLLQTTDS